MARYTGMTRRAMLGGALVAPAVVRAEPVLPAFTQEGRQFVFLSPARLAPNVLLPTSDGKTVPLLEPASRGPSILYFGATWCPPCRRDLAAAEARLSLPGPHPRLVTILTDSGGAGIVVPFLKRSGLKRPVALDPQQAVAKTTATARPGDPFVLWTQPISYVVSPGGRIIGYLPGTIDWTRPEVAAFLRAVAAAG